MRSSFSLSSKKYIVKHPYGRCGSSFLFYMLIITNIFMILLLFGPNKETYHFVTGTEVISPPSPTSKKPQKRHTSRYDDATPQGHNHASPASSPYIIVSRQLQAIPLLLALLGRKPQPTPVNNTTPAVSAPAPSPASIIIPPPPPPPQPPAPIKPISVIVPSKPIAAPVLANKEPAISPLLVALLPRPTPVSLSAPVSTIRPPQGTQPTSVVAPKPSSTISIIPAPTTPTNGAKPTSVIPSPTSTTIIAPNIIKPITTPTSTFLGSLPTRMITSPTTSQIIIPTATKPATGVIIIPPPQGIPITTPTLLGSLPSRMITSPTTPVKIKTPTSSGIITTPTPPTSIIVITPPSSPTAITKPTTPINNNTVTYLSLPIRMKCGTTLVSTSNTTTYYTDTYQQKWIYERYLIDPYNTTTMITGPNNTSIGGTFDDILYQSIRTGPSFGYEIPVPLGNYDITLYFVELFYNASGQRIFSVQVEDEIISNIDIVNQVGKYTKYTLEFQQSIDDGNISIQLLPPDVTLMTNNSVAITNGLPIICGIDIEFVGTHSAHAVSGGPYTAIDKSNLGYATVPVDGSDSHTHGVGLTISNIVWTEGNKVLGRGKLTTSFDKMSVGNHEITLMIQDSGGSTSYDQTTITVHPNYYPSITSISPTNGSISGLQEITLTGSGFTSASSSSDNTNVTVIFGDIVLSNNSITYMSRNMIKLITPPSLIAADVPIRVMNSLGTSTEYIPYTYLGSSIPIAFQSFTLFQIAKVAACAFGPDKNLYLGTTQGTLGRYSVDFFGSSKPVVKTSFVQQVISTERAIFGIAFDPMDTNYAFPKVYFSSSDMFHGDSNSSSGLSINGKISCVTTTPSSFTNLVDIITGLPVSDHDHGLNAIVFGNHGELYISSGGNTNGGRPGKMSTTSALKESYLSAAIIKADLRDPNFSGTIRYTADDNGDMIATGIEVYASGLRNAFGLMIHSNGNLYATDNGPNIGYGQMLTGCGPNQFMPDRTDVDKLCYIQQNGYYGHPNPKRAMALNDTRQCVWRPTTSTADGQYTPPIAILPSGMEGMTEYNANYFDGQMRGNLLIAKYGDGLFRFVLTPDGTNVLAQSRTGIPIANTDKGLAVTVSPDGCIVEGRYVAGNIVVEKPVEPATTTMKLYSVFPVRGPSTGGNVISIYGINFQASISVTAAGINCSNVKVISTRQIDCTLPGGTPGLVDIIVTGQGMPLVMLQAYRYITGMPEI